jgi:hypothetical protein
VRTFAQKQPQKQVASGFARSNTAIPGLNHTTPLQHLQRTIDGQAIQRLPQTNAEEIDLNSTGTAASCYAHDFSGIPVHAQRQTGAEKLIQRRTTGDTHVETAPPNAHEVLRSSGHPLDTATRAFMEPRFGHDFSRVRVHLDSQAAASARDVGALAYTVGCDIVFAQGQFSPRNAAGQQLLAHELAHTVQQSAGGDRVITRDLRVGTKNDPLEREAERLSISALSGRGKTPSEAPPTTALRSDGYPTLRRQPKPDRHIPEVPPITTLPKREEAGGKAPTAAVSACKPPSDAKLPCSPTGVSNAEIVKKGVPENVFGITPFQRQTIGAPTVDTESIGKSKKVRLRKTTATQISCESFFTKAGFFSRTVPIDASKQPALARTCGDSFEIKYEITSGGEKKIREAEMEHCQDYKYAFDISLGCYEAVVNKLAKEKKEFDSPEDAENAVTKGVGGRKPDTWGTHYAELLLKSGGRDVKPREWHTRNLQI